MDVASNSDHRPGGLHRFQVALEAVISPLDVEKSNAFELAHVSQIGVASAWQPAKSAGDSEDAATVSYEFQDHLVECGFIFSRGKERYHPTALVRRIIRKLARTVQRYRKVICEF